MEAHRARKRFGQHFLHDANVIAKIVRFIAPKPGEMLVEIGPGLGALTKPLLAAAGALQAVELDRDVIPHLLETCANHPGLKIHQADALEFDFRSLGSKLRLCGNLPYNISTPLLFHLLEQSDAITDMHFMLQKEVVERICAAPDSEHYGRLTVALYARAEPAKLFEIGPGAFNPPPQVDSAVVRLTPRPAPFPIADLARFDAVVKAAFGQRRKTLSNALKGLLNADQIRRAGIDPIVRAEALPPEAFARLAGQIIPA
ncbi:MAG: 16S rRNA (adenine(1518)-N(6)/adenine(1519)-N(6))-dimethyltransferase RsmA [Pseudomonadota bacterium]